MTAAFEEFRVYIFTFRSQGGAHKQLSGQLNGVH